MDGLDVNAVALEALSQLYITMHLIDLHEDRVKIIKSNTAISRAAAHCGYDTDNGSVKNAIRFVMASLVEKIDTKRMIDFVDFSTLPERIKGKSSLSILFLSKIHGWCRARIVRVGDDSLLRYVLFLVESIDEQTKEIEGLKAQLEVSGNILDTLIDEYTTVIELNLRNGLIKTYKFKEDVRIDYDRLHKEINYDILFDFFIHNVAHEEDRELVNRMLNREQIINELDYANTFTRIFRNNKGLYLEAKVVKYGADSVIIAFVEKHEEIIKHNNLIYVDSLTKINNRRFLDERLLHRKCDAIAMIDVDNFKNINDTQGHQCGDVALESIAAELSRCIGDKDYIVRYGGDEFLAVFVGIEYEELVDKLEGLRNAIENITLDNYPEIRLSLSIGGAYGRGVVRDMINEADKALYDAKTNRNAVTIYRV